LSGFLKNNTKHQPARQEIVVFFKRPGRQLGAFGAPWERRPSSLKNATACSWFRFSKFHPAVRRPAHCPWRAP